MNIFAHRGDLDDHPENTIEGMQSALDEGADGIEFDVGRSQDSVWFLMHDTSIDRTTDGVGSIKNLTAAYIESLHVVGGEGYRPQDHGTRYSVPRLDDVLDMAESYLDRQLIFHIKTLTQQGYIEIANIIVARELQARAFILVDKQTWLPDVKAIDPAIRTIVGNEYELPALPGVDAPLIDHAQLDALQDVDQYPVWDAYAPVGDSGELATLAKCLQWGGRNVLINHLHDALAYTFAETYPMPDAIKVFPAGSIPSGVTASNTAGDAYLNSVVLPDMTVDGLSIRTKVANTGIVKWGLFDGTTKVCGGQGTLAAGWCNLDATTPTAVTAGAYSLVIAQPLTAAPTVYILDGGTSNLVWRALSYAWSDILDPGLFGTPYVGPITCFLYGD